MAIDLALTRQRENTEGDCHITLAKKKRHRLCKEMLSTWSRFGLCGVWKPLPVSIKKKILHFIGNKDIFF